MPAGRCRLTEAQGRRHQEVPSQTRTLPLPLPLNPNPNPNPDPDPGQALLPAFESLDTDGDGSVTQVTPDPQTLT